MTERFIYLLVRYLDKTASPREMEEFRAQAGLPENEMLVKTEIDKVLKSENLSQDSGDDLGRQIYARMLEENNISQTRHIGLPLLRAMAAAAVLIIGIGMALYFKDKRAATLSSPIATKTEVQTKKIYSGKSFIRLPDGSTVMLKDSGELIVLEKDGRFLREVIVKGEAFFDISHDAEHTFVVHADKVNTKVLGTAFNVRTQNGKVEVKVTRGLVEVGSDRVVFGKIKAKEQIRVNTNSNVFRISAMQPIETTPVADIALNFEETSLTDVFELIARKYHYQIFLENPELGPCRISASFTGKEDLQFVLATICATRNLEYTTELDKILIKGGIACK